MVDRFLKNYTRLDGGALDNCLETSFPGGLVVGLEPVHGLADGLERVEVSYLKNPFAKQLHGETIYLLDGGELEVWQVRPELGVGGSLLVLAVRLVGQILDLAL